MKLVFNFRFYSMMKETRKVAITIPYYKNDLTKTEQESLKACMNILYSYDIFLISPISLDTSKICKQYPQLKVKTFNNSYFNSLRGYNKLMLCENFYAQFTDYTYILIYQLDAFVFKDELLLWANKDYDYIGAPWIHASKYSNSKGETMKCKLKRSWYRLTNNKKRLRKYCWGGVGNGGFSLRKVSKMLQITHAYRDKITEHLDDNQPFYAEDLWLLLELKHKDRLKKPSFKEALSFSIETIPEKAYQWNNNTLPFGCHAFDRNPYKKFWSAFINCLNAEKPIRAIN